MSFQKGNTYGKKPKYSKKEEIEGLIDKYFEDCQGHMLINEMTGDPVLDKWGSPVYVDRHPPTVTGLALALGFSTRRALLRYQAKAEFQDTILRAKSMVEKYTEERLFDKDGSNGAKFSLQFNFDGWRDEPSEEEKRPVINIINDIPKPAEAAEVATQSEDEAKDKVTDSGE